MHTAMISKWRTDPLFYVATILLCFWLLDTYYKLVIFHSVTQLFWWSSAGLLVTIIALYTKNSTLFTAMLCALFVPELIWSLSFLSNFFFQSDPFVFAGYIFAPHVDTLRFVIGLYHLGILPALAVGWFFIPLNTKGWVYAYIFALSISYITYLFPDSYVNVNCTQALNVERCNFYFGPLYPLHPLFRIWVAATILLIGVFLPLNYLFLYLSKKYRPALYKT